MRSPTIGHNFESFIIEEIIKGLHAAMIPKWDYYYYRTRNGVEIDLILEGSFGVIPIEIKFGVSTHIKQLTSLNKFILDNDLSYGIVINQSKEIRLLNERIIQIPASCL